MLRRCGLVAGVGLPPCVVAPLSSRVCPLLPFSAAVRTIHSNPPRFASKEKNDNDKPKAVRNTRRGGAPVAPAVASIWSGTSSSAASASSSASAPTNAATTAPTAASSSNTQPNTTNSVATTTTNDNGVASQPQRERKKRKIRAVKDNATRAARNARREEIAIAETVLPASAEPAPKLSLAQNPPIITNASQSEIPKQKVQMYTKILRVIRSPVKGLIKNTDGNDYVLDATEAQPATMFTGLISANLTGPGKKSSGKKSGKETGRSYGKGGRKSARAHVWIQKAIQKGTGDFYVNGLRYVEYFHELDHRWELCAPFYYTNTLTDFDMIAVVRGGGRSGQAGAIKHAAAKALQAYDRARYRPLLKKKFLLTRDARVVERKKYGQVKARKKFTFVKR